MRLRKPLALLLTVFLALSITFLQFGFLSVHATVAFTDGFETGNMSNWTANSTSNGGANTVDAASAHSGSYGARATTDGSGVSATALCYKSFTAITPAAYGSTWFKFNTLTSVTSYQYITAFYSGSSVICRIILRKTASTYNWSLSYLSSGESTFSEKYATTGPTTGIWYMLQLYEYRSDTVGQYIVYVDGVAVITTAADINNTGRGTVSRYYNGIITSSATNLTLDYSYDDATVQDSYIPYGTEKSYTCTGQLPLSPSSSKSAENLFAGSQQSALSSQGVGNAERIYGGSDSLTLGPVTQSGYFGQTNHTNYVTFPSYGDYTTGFVVGHWYTLPYSNTQITQISAYLSATGTNARASVGIYDSSIYKVWISTALNITTEQWYNWTVSA
ncbi:hypothetical protein MUP79_01310, partial [Candidatus Bathyarchaeota archaeon]|nr:hypothetical protein [Candidatus Bathyarchaeota archaeon]